MDTIVPQRVCKKCSNSLPLTSEFWHKDQKAPHGFGYTCKTCRLNSNHQNYEENKQAILDQCREYRRANIERVSAREREYARTHAEQRSQKDKLWREKNKKRKSQNARIYHEANREKDNDRVKRWKKANPGRVREINNNRRAMKLNAGGDGFTDADRSLQLRSQKGICWWCSKPMGEDITIDHVIALKRGGKHDPRNIVLCHLKCNCSKNDKLPQEWAGRLF